MPLKCNTFNRIMNLSMAAQARNLFKLTHCQPNPLPLVSILINYLCLTITCCDATLLFTRTDPPQTAYPVPETERRTVCRRAGFHPRVFQCLFPDLPLLPPDNDQRSRQKLQRRTEDQPPALSQAPEF